MAMGLTLPSASVQVAAVSELKLTASPLEAVAVSVTAGSPTDLSVRAVKVMVWDVGDVVVAVGQATSAAAR
jgi:hypothetical protein